MRILVTGSTGFVGARVVATLRDRGHEVLMVVRRSPSPAAADGGLTLQVDFARPGEAVERICAVKPEAVLHLAWPAQPPGHERSPENLDALEFSLKLFQSLRESRCGAVIGVGSALEYASGGNAALRENAPQNLAANLHVTCKQTVRALGATLFNGSDTRFVWVRLFNAYGPGDGSERIIPSTIRRMLTRQGVEIRNGAAQRDFIHIDDVARGFQSLIESESVGEFNLASGRPVSVGELAEQLYRLAPLGDAPRVSFPPAGEPISSVVGDNSRLRALGWAPEVEMSQGLEQTVAWWRSRLGS